MFVLDSLFVSGLRWVLDKVATAVDSEMNDDSVLREELLAAEMRRELGEISDDEFAAIEADLLSRIREIRDRREGGGGPIVFGRAGGESDSELQVEATVSGDFHGDPPGAPAESVPPSAAASSTTRGPRRPPGRRRAGAVLRRRRPRSRSSR